MTGVRQKSYSYPRSILKQFRKVLLISYVISLVVSIAGIGIWTSREVYTAADRELSLLVDMVKAARTYVAKDVRPYMLPKGIFHPAAVSSTVATKHIAGHFAKSQPDYYIRVVSDNPLNSENSPTPFEEKILETFRQDRNIDNIVLEGSINDRQFLVSSRPSVSRESCLLCHGTPDKAPKEIIDAYGTESGFGYENNAVVGASVVGVPINNVNQIILVRSLIAFAFISVLFSIIFFSIDRLVRFLLLKPIIKISHIARSVSEGNLDQSISTKRQDEIGELVKSFELMRRSLVTASKRIRRVSKRNK